VPLLRLLLEVVPPANPAPYLDDSGRTSLSQLRLAPREFCLPALQLSLTSCNIAGSCCYNRRGRNKSGHCRSTSSRGAACTPRTIGRALPACC
jgi:hypothetical protein